jgi:uncharacterized membrane protein SpoIIM required for sporulation
MFLQLILLKVLLIKQVRVNGAVVGSAIGIVSGNIDAFIWVRIVVGDT